MAYSLVSTYDNFAAAEQARAALLASGFPSSSIFLSSQQDEAGGQVQPVGSPMALEKTQPDSYLLTLDADDPAELGRASDIVSRYGALDVSQRTVIGKGDEA